MTGWSRRSIEIARASGISLVLFDVSGVLLELSGGPASLLEGHPDPWEAWSRSDSVREFEKGLLAPRDFAKSFVEEFDSTRSPKEILDEFASWPERLSPDLPRVVAALHIQGITTATLSNSNVIHWAQIVEAGLAESIGYHFASHQTGRVKPDADAFVEVLRHFRREPCESLLLDDSERNVAAARDVGLHAFVVEGFGEVVRLLGRLGLIGI